MHPEGKSHSTHVGVRVQQKSGSYLKCMCAIRGTFMPSSSPVSSCTFVSTFNFLSVSLWASRQTTKTQIAWTLSSITTVFPFILKQLNENKMKGYFHWTGVLSNFSKRGKETRKIKEDEITYFLKRILNPIIRLSKYLPTILIVSKKSNDCCCYIVRSFRFLNPGYQIRRAGKVNCDWYTQKMVCHFPELSHICACFHG